MLRDMLLPVPSARARDHRDMDVMLLLWETYLIQNQVLLRMLPNISVGEML